jgi:uncharacterized sulfatase
MVSLVDLLPTFIDVAGATPPDDIDGKSFLPVLRGERDTHRSVIFATHTGDGMMNRSPSRMLRTARYKYILNLAPENEYHTHMDKADDHDGGREYWTSWLERAKTDKHAVSVLERYHRHPVEELYDLDADPDEKNNLAVDNKHAALIRQYRKELTIWRKHQGDYETGPEKLDLSPLKDKTPVAPYVFLE